MKRKRHQEPVCGCTAMEQGGQVSPPRSQPVEGPPAHDPVPCRACQAPILFVASLTGKRIPLNALPDPERGNVVIGSPSGRARVLKRDDAALARAAGVVLYLSHFVTCPNAGEFRR